MAILAKVRANEKKKNGEANEDKPKKGDLRKTEEIKCEDGVESGPNQG